MKQLIAVCQTQKLAGEPSLEQIPVEGYRVVLDGLTLSTPNRRSGNGY
jgi:hypothetical protein